MGKLLSVIIPSYNEANTISILLDKVQNTQLVEQIDKEIIIVNDCSKDYTVLFVEKYISMPWDWKALLYYNPNTTPKFIEKYMSKFGLTRKISYTFHKTTPRV